jgi:hypothetical protein
MSHKYEMKKMKTKKTVTLGSNPPMPESLRKAYELAAHAAWICAQTEAEAIWREKLEILDTQALEAAQLCAAQTAEILDLRKMLTSSESKAETASSIAREEIAKASLRIAVLTDAARRAAANAVHISTQLESLMINLRPTSASPAQTPSAEIHSEPETPDPSHDLEQRPATEDTGGVGSTSATPRATAERRAALLRDESELLAAAAVLIKAMCRFNER